MSEPTLDRETQVSQGNGSHWVRELNAWRENRRRRLPRKRVLAAGLGALGVLAALAYGFYWWHWSTVHVSTDDAFISGHIAPVSARVKSSRHQGLSGAGGDPELGCKSGEVIVGLGSPVDLVSA